MKFTITHDSMKAALGAVQGCVESKTTIPVLRNTLIESISDTQIQVSGTNLDIAIRIDAEASVSVPGSICIPSRKLFDVVRSLDHGDITFESEDNNWVKLKCGKSNFRFAGVPKESYPAMPLPKEMPVTVNGDVLSDMIRKVIFAITNEASRFTLSGAKFIVADGKATMISTDGHRLAYCERTPAEGQPSLDGIKLDVLIPKLALNEAAKMGHAGGVQVGEDINHIFFSSGGQLLSARKLTGQFPNYEAVMPKDSDKCVIVDGDAFKAAVRRMAIMSDPRNRSMRITAAQGEVRLTASSSEEGGGLEVIDAEYAGDETLLGFNHQYLGEFLNLVKPDKQTDEKAEGSDETPLKLKVLILFKDSTSQVELKLAGDDGFRYIVMPLRV